MLLSISAVIITKNNSNLLLKCLAALDWVDEIIILDSGSKDDIIESVSHLTKIKLFKSTNWKGYGIQRQRAQSYATSDYILMIDTDECLTPVLQQSIKAVLTRPKDSIVYSIARLNYFLGRFMQHGGWYPDRVLRLYARDYYKYNDKQVHESLVCEGAQVIPLKGDLMHLTCRNFISFQQKQLDYAATWAHEHFLKGKKISFAGIFIHALCAFIKTLILHGGVLDGKQGWLLAVVNAQYTFNKYTELWALNLGYSDKKY